LNDFHGLNTNQRKRAAPRNCPFISHPVDDGGGLTAY
jgi:hypothetical protein